MADEAFEVLVIILFVLTISKLIFLSVVAKKIQFCFFSSKVIELI
jgi:hypothetical protein